MAFCIAPQSALQIKLNSQIIKLRSEVEAKDRELAVNIQSLEETRAQKVVINKMQEEIKQNIRQTKMKIINLLKEKMEVEKQLQLKEQELQLQCTGHDSNSEQLWNIRNIRNKEKEDISELTIRLQNVEKELTSERMYSEDLKEKLQRATTKLEKKSTMEQEQEKVTEILKANLERERQLVDNLWKQLTSADTSKDQYIKELKVVKNHACKT